MARTRAPQPKWPIARLSDIAAATLALADEHRADLEPRLGAGVLDHLRADLAAFDGKRSEATTAGATLKAATRTQSAAAAAGHAFVSGVRHGVSRAPGVTKADQKAFGVGEKQRASSVPQVLAWFDAQAAVKETKKSSTATRNALASGISAGVDAILAVTLVAFYARPDVRARFEALVPGRSRKAKLASPGPAPAPS